MITGMHACLPHCADVSPISGSIHVHWADVSPISGPIHLSRMLHDCKSGRLVRPTAHLVMPEGLKVWDQLGHSLSI